MSSSVAAIVAPTSFDGLRLDRSTQFVVARLLPWDSRNIKKQGEFMGITLLFLDEQNSVIHGLIPAARGHYRTKNMFLHSTAGTKFYFGNNITAITEFTMSLRDAVGEDLPSLKAETMITTKELSPMGDLSMFLSSSSSQHHIHSLLLHRKLILLAWIVEVVAQNGWYYISCTHCGKEHVNSATSHPCDQCNDINATTVVRCKVELLVDDGKNYATFLVLDKEMMKLTKQDAATLLDDEVNRGLGNTLPKCIAELQGRVFIYHVHVTPYNFTDNTRTFTISGMNYKEVL
ncbi:hypothetical protein Rs2_03101 [Raphanus sativus]|nr:hypothetical protein Rs2_03101 [Raphanus sativus]